MHSSPPCSMKSIAASIFGPMEPAGNSPSAKYLRASSRARTSPRSANRTKALQRVPRDLYGKAIGHARSTGHGNYAFRRPAQGFGDGG